MAEMEFKEDDSKVGHCALAYGFHWASKMLILREPPFQQCSYPAVSPPP